MYKYILTHYCFLLSTTETEHLVSFCTYLTSMAILYSIYCFVSHSSKYFNSPVCALIGGSLPLILLDLMKNIPRGNAAHSQPVELEHR